MKKVFGGILLVVAGLNIIAIIGRIAHGVSIGSKFYLILIGIMIIFGTRLVSSKSVKDNSDLTAENDDA